MLEQDRGEALEDGVDAKSVVARRVLVGGDEGVVLVDDELEDRGVVLDRDGEPHVSGIVYMVS